jgi:hypothetical protein
VIIDTVHHPDVLASEAGDVCAWVRRRMVEASLGIPERRTEAELVEDLAAEEERIGRELSAGERQAFALGYFSPSYTAGLAFARVVGQGLPIKDD